MATETAVERHSGSALPSAISTTIVRLMPQYTGRGPLRARTTIRDNVVLVMLEQTLTKGEEVLVENGRGESVLALRREYQDVMRDESSEKIAELTGRDVIEVVRANHLVPDLAAEIYVLDGPPVHREGSSPAGSRLPSDRDLAEAFPANPMTGAQPPRLDFGNLDVLEVTTPDVAQAGD